MTETDPEVRSREWFLEVNHDTYISRKYEHRDEETPEADPFYQHVQVHRVHPEIDMVSVQAGVKTWFVPRGKLIHVDEVGDNMAVRTLTDEEKRTMVNAAP